MAVADYQRGTILTLANIYSVSKSAICYVSRAISGYLFRKPSYLRGNLFRKSRYLRSYLFRKPRYLRGNYPFPPPSFSHSPSLGSGASSATTAFDTGC